jgi:hypothetical protein
VIKTATFQRVHETADQLRQVRRVIGRVQRGVLIPAILKQAGFQMR